MNFEELIQAINNIHFELQQKAVSSVNKNLTIRNWIIGFYIFEFEQKGEDRAKYGDKLIENISKRIYIKGFSKTNLKIFRQFYITYRQIGQLLTDQFKNEKFSTSLKNSLSKKLGHKHYGVNIETLLNGISFTHIVEFIKIDDPLKRAFYELECLKGNWSVTELKRQIASLYFERIGLSKDQLKLSEYTQNKVVKLLPKDVIQSPFLFDFLDLKDKEVIKESDLEEALMDKLHDFILELGNGFCFEARQKRITIGDEYFWVDLVFYHRILKCHVLFELKLDKFNHENMGQLNTYLNYFKKNIMEKDDNPPVGVLLCTDMNHSLVEFATMGIDNQLFVSKYLLSLPSKEQLQKFIDEEISKIGD